MGCPSCFTNIIIPFHDDMSAKVIDSGNSSKSVEVTNGVKQGCVLVSLLFNHFLHDVSYRLQEL